MADPRDILKVRIQLDSLHCFDEGDGWGDAEPYLWPVFFKIDGETCSLGDSLNLVGGAHVEGTFGHHGNLNNTDVDAGDTVSIPESVGAWETNLKPIPVPPSLQGLVPDVAGVAGVIVVLMEEDNVSDDGAKAGYAALVDAIRTGLNAIVPTLGFSQQDISDGQIDALQASAASAVENAIKNSQGFFSNLWSWLNADDQIGSEIFKFGHDQLAGGNQIPISKRWRNEGDWEIRGHAIGSVLCPASAIEGAQGLLGAIFGAREMKAMRAFRDKELRAIPGLGQWWNLARRNVLSILWLLQSDREALELMRRIAPQAGGLIEKPESPIPADFIADAQKILDRAAASPFRKLRSDAKLAGNLLQLSRGRNAGQMVELAGKLAPSRSVSRAEFKRLLRPQ